jgi:PKD repeat protein
MRCSWTYIGPTGPAWGLPEATGRAPDPFRAARRSTVEGAGDGDTRRRAVLVPTALALLALIAFGVPRWMPTQRGLASPLSATTHDELRTLPAEARATISRTLGAANTSFLARRTRVGYALSGDGMNAQLGRGGLRLNTGEGSLSMALSAVGRGAILRQIPAAPPGAHTNRVSYGYKGIAAWYAAGPLGIEQGFTLARRPAGRGGTIVLALSLQSSLRAVHSGAQVELLGPGGRVTLRYGGLSVDDADGRSLPAWLSLSRGRLLIHVADAGARYPLRIDPLIQREEVAANETEGYGYSVAISADGNTALVGGSGNDSGVGAAWVFTRSGSTWVQQERLTGAGESGEGDFGSSVALSADGDTALIGAPGDGHIGAAWVFKRSGSTWTQQGPKLTGAGEVGEGKFGYSVALSADGSTALVGGFWDYGLKGAAWVFSHTGSSWTQQGAKLAPNNESGREESDFGYSVALSADGDTALIGGPYDSEGEGAAWVFTRSSSTWSQGEKLTVTEKEPSEFGSSVSLSADGDTALIGAPSAFFADGEAWVFTRSGSTWTQQGERLTPPPGQEAHIFGSSVALSADGDVALIGGPRDFYAGGAVWVYTRTGETWSQQGSELKSSGYEFGSGIALSANGQTALITTSGQLWAYSAGPQISSPSSLSFPQQMVGQHSPVEWLQVQDGGAAPLTPLLFSGAPQITGSDASEFAIPTADDLCSGEMLDPGQACWIGVQFTPTATGPRSATLNFGANNGSAEAPTVALSGIGTLPPTASFTITRNPGTAGTTIAFDGVDSSAPDGSIERFSWTFGDGKNAEGVGTSHIYTAPGAYAVTLTVTDNYGLTAKATQTVTVREAQTIEFTSSPPNSATAGGPAYPISAIASSGLPVSLSSATPSVCRLLAAIVTFVAPGTCKIDANQAGGAEYGPAPEVQQSFAVNPAPSTSTSALVSTLPPATILLTSRPTRAPDDGVGSSSTRSRPPSPRAPSASDRRRRSARTRRASLRTAGKLKHRMAKRGKR